MSFMFYYCKNLEEINLPPYFVTDKVRSMQCMFKNCQKLKKFDFKKFKIKEIKNVNVNYMFDGCNKLKNIPDKIKNIINIIFDENLKEYEHLKFEKEYVNKQKLNEQGYSNNSLFPFEINKGFATVKEYDNNGEILFEGEYLNREPLNKTIDNNDNIELSLKNGYNQVKKYGNDGKLLFDGVYLNKKKLIKKGKEYKNNGK